MAKYNSTTIKYNPIDWEKISFEEIPDDVWAKKIKETLKKLLSEMKQNLQQQKAYLSNRQNEFTDIVTNSTLNKKTNGC